MNKRIIRLRRGECIDSQDSHDIQDYEILN